MHLTPDNPADPTCDLYLTGVLERPEPRIGEPIYVQRDGCWWVIRDCQTGRLLKYTEEQVGDAAVMANLSTSVSR